MEIFGNPKLALQNNNHRVGIHSRTLAAMVESGFMFTHNSLIDNLLVGKKTVFEPSVLYGCFDFDNLAEETEKYLFSDKQREKIAERASRLFLSEMHWINGATQLAMLFNLQR